MFSRSVANSFELGGRPDLAYFVTTVNNWFDTMDSRRPFHKYNQFKSGLGVHCTGSDSKRVFRRC